ncbi:MAG: hypothetical protein KC656_12160, partial [Myxococcales bacterium]|nr:hypothetical protein [Myxococcales bacterium]
ARGVRGRRGPGQPTVSVEALRTRWRPGAHAGVLHELVGRWRDCRHPELAGLIAVLDRGGPPLPPGGEPVVALKRVWRAGDVRTVRAAVDGLFLVGPEVARALFARRPGWLDDPRTVDALLHGLRTLPATFGSVRALGFWGEALRYLASSGDPRVAPALAALDLGVRSPVGGLVAQLRPRWPDEVAEPDGLDALRAWRVALGEVADPVAELLAAVHERPADAAPRAVLADRLQEAGDPRGEAIARGLAGLSSSALDREHGDRWLDGLGPQVARAVCVGGFVERVTLRVGATLDPSLPAWRTVRCVDLAGRTDASELLAALPLLAEIRGASTLDGIPGHLEGLELRGRPEEVDALLADPGWPALRRVRVGCPARPSHLPAEPTGLPALERIRLASERRGALAEVVEWGCLASVVLETPGWVFERLREPAGVRLSVRAQGQMVRPARLVAALEGVRPERLLAVELVGLPEAVAARVREVMPGVSVSCRSR